MPPLTNPKVLEAAKRILDGEDCHTVLTAVGLDLSENVKRNVMKKFSAARKQLDACHPPAAPELLTALQKTADVAAATAAAALSLAEGAQKAAAAAAAAPKTPTSWAAAATASWRRRCGPIETPRRKSASAASPRRTRARP